MRFLVLIVAAMALVVVVGAPAEGSTDVTKFMGQTGWRSVQAVTATTSGLAPAGGGRADRFLNGTGAMAAILTTAPSQTYTPVATPSAPTTGCLVFMIANPPKLQVRWSDGTVQDLKAK